MSADDKASSSSMDGDNSSSSSLMDKFVPFDKRPEWSDLTPIHLDDQEKQLINIAYTERYRGAYALFRAILKADERSQRALELTKECLLLNPANYTVWTFRRLVLQELNADLWQELDFLDETTEENQKNYQVWQHRKRLIEQIISCEKKNEDAKTEASKSQATDDQSQQEQQTNVKTKLIEREKQFIASIIGLDSKNYHAWQHRQWLVRRFLSWEGELDFINGLLKSDLRNNSAWNHRYFVLHNSGQLEQASTREQEVQYTLEKIKLAPSNESSWNYLRGLLFTQGLDSSKQVSKQVDDLLAEGCTSPHLFELKVDLLRCSMRKQKDGSLLEKATGLCRKLMEQYDRIRKRYWQWVQDDLISEFSN